MVSFKTAKALDDAGFPKPENFRAGQFWYVDRMLCVIIGVDSDIQVYYAPLADFWTDGAVQQNNKYGLVRQENPYDFGERDICFAPSVHDILAHLKNFTMSKYPERNLRISILSTSSGNEVILPMLDIKNADSFATAWIKEQEDLNAKK